jgi:UPF0716 protein FxsA
MIRILRFALPAWLLLEAAVTLTIASWLGSGRTVLLFVLGAAAGVAVLRTAQFTVLSQMRRIFASGEPPLGGLLDGALRGAAGVLLIIPGFISDLAAVVLLIPYWRKRLVRRLSGGFGGEPAGPPVIEGDFRRIDDPALPAPRVERR